jgi:hypothetical protein
VALSPAERSRRYRLRKRGVDIPRGRPGRRSNEDSFEKNASPTPEEIVARLLSDAKPQDWDGIIAAGEGASEAQQTMQKLLAMVRGGATE